MKSSFFKLGIDIGSTTLKCVMTDSKNQWVFSRYQRHQAKAGGLLSDVLDEIQRGFGNCQLAISISGSVGMGFAERYHLPFVQEVVAACDYIKAVYPQSTLMIDIGGEDAKIISFKANGSRELRMNGNCSGGTGAFIDQMSALLRISNQEMNLLAEKAERIHPIASRCGVFSKTDIQNLVSKNVSKADISASVFHAVAVQTATTLLRGTEDFSSVMLLGGPFTFMPALQKAFCDYFSLTPSQLVKCSNPNLITAFGAAHKADQTQAKNIDEWMSLFHSAGNLAEIKHTQRLEAIFENELEYEQWKKEKAESATLAAPLSEHKGKAFLGIDSGSTTTKIILINEKGESLFHYYAPNAGSPIASVLNGLQELQTQCMEAKLKLQIHGSCVTGYGEDLIKAAFDLNHGIVETIAHFMAARNLTPDLSFILDIGGQDMKAMFVDNGTLHRLEINEACSSGCGSFIETFAHSMNYNTPDFARLACTASYPCDLGTRCTVFMNSKVKQVMREGASVGDISAGLSYSVIKNCLHKVLKIKNYADFGKGIVVQGGTMRNDAIVRVFEKLIGIKVHRSNIPELMGAYGCALFAKSQTEIKNNSLESFLSIQMPQTELLNCSGCENQCQINKYIFNGRAFFSGNKCEKIFSNKGEAYQAASNMSVEKNRIIFALAAEKPKGNGLRIGLPRALNIYENFPFWHTLLCECGFNPILSDPSTFNLYEKGAPGIMSDNICFPAKLMHGHIQNLIEKKVDRILVPYVVFEKESDKSASNSYNCPIVTAYSDVLKSVYPNSVPIDSPVISFNDNRQLLSACTKYLGSLNISEKNSKEALKKALAAQAKKDRCLTQKNQESFLQAQQKGQLCIVLAGRPYHSDPLIQHKLSDMIANFGVCVLSEDLLYDKTDPDYTQVHLIPQWSYINRIVKTAQWVAEQGENVQMVQMTSFGCGPDAFMIDQIQEILKKAGKTLSLIKLDDVNNLGSVKLRVRSLIESLRFKHSQKSAIKTEFKTTKEYSKKKVQTKFLMPTFSPFISPLLPELFRRAGHEVEVLDCPDIQSVEYGLKYANNEVCYPATIVIGDLIKALNSGQYDLANTAVLISQTGGQCRATNYLSMLKQGMVDAGFQNIPVVSIGFDSDILNKQSGFRIDWIKMADIIFSTVLYADTIAKLYYASIAREKEKGAALFLRNLYLEKASAFVQKGKSRTLLNLLADAVKDFSAIIEKKDLPRIGIVGEIYLKFNGFANKNVDEWIMEKGIEICPPILLNFFMQYFVNADENEKEKISRRNHMSLLRPLLYRFLKQRIKKVNKIGSLFPYFIPFQDIYSEAEHGKQVVSLSAQFGEGWLLPAEVGSYVNSGVHHILSLQPFGCIANHVIAKGVENKLKELYPHLNILFLDFDASVSDVNIENRLHLFLNSMQL